MIKVERLKSQKIFIHKAEFKKTKKKKKNHKFWLYLNQAMIWNLRFWCKDRKKAAESAALADLEAVKGSEEQS